MTDKTPPIGYIRVHKHVSPENGRVRYTFTKWTGTDWVPCKPRKALELVAGRTTRGGGVYNEH
jgi:hypothetical protein